MDHTKALAFLETLSPMELSIVKAFYDAHKLMRHSGMTERELSEATGLSRQQVHEICVRLADRQVMDVDYSVQDDYWVFGAWE